jgi:hypothetical protein
MRTYYNSGNRGTFNPLSPGGIPVTTIHQETINEALVIDVITNDSHPEYSKDGYNIGAIKFRSLKGDMFRNENNLQWAYPIETNISEYPLLNEIVLIYSILNRIYYTRKVNVSSRITTHAIDGLNEEMAPIETSESRTNGFRKHSSEKQLPSKTSSKFGKYFKELESNYRLRHDEGDIILEGRSGQSIRLGAAWVRNTLFNSTSDQSPNILMRVGPDPNQTPGVGKFGLIQENVNNDSTSLYLVSNQLIPLKYSTIDASNHLKSISDAPKKLEGAQVVINTDRIILNSKSDKIMGFAKNGIHWTTNKNFTVDSDQDYVSTITRDELIDIGNNESIKVGKDSTFKIGNIYDLTAEKRASIVAPKVYLGLHEGEDEPVSCGALLADFIEKFLSAFIDNSTGVALVTAAPGSPSPLNPKILSELISLKKDVARGAKASFNSKVAFTTKEKI